MTINRRPSKAQANLLTTVSKLRVTSKLDTLSRTDLVAVESAIQIQLGL